MNKGIKLSNGKIIGFIKTDDFYVDNFVIENILRKFDSNSDLGVFIVIFSIFQKIRITFKVLGNRKFKTILQKWMASSTSYFF